MDSSNYYVRRIYPNGTIAAACGTKGGAGYSGDNAPATSGKLWTPLGVSLDGQGGFFVADQATNTIRRVRWRRCLASARCLNPWLGVCPAGVSGWYSDDVRRERDEGAVQLLVERVDARAVPHLLHFNVVHCDGDEPGLVG